MMLFLIIVYGLLSIVEGLLNVFFLARFKPVKAIIEDKLPNVSILVCARNEEHNLRGCLTSVLASDYPMQLVEILVGNDDSEDGTAQIITQFESEYEPVRAVDIQHQKDGLIAKGNVLSQLIDSSRYDYQIIIDADMEVSPKWLQTMVSALHCGYDMVSGFTQVKKTNWISRLQYIDWQTVLHSMKTMADLIRPISILGNNMAFNKNAYDQVGGFRGLGPTDVEDLGLLQRFQNRCFKTFQLVDGKGVAYTKPQLTFKELLTQRCRWMNGVFTHHLILGIPAFFARLWVVLGLIAFSVQIELGCFILAYGIFFSWLKCWLMSQKIASKGLIFLVEPIIISLLDTLALLRLIFVGKVSWKGRKY
ncbi:glycosyltransferase [Roseivirga sp.]|uniref:glycosyltransferase n=1 Tax=Roseivirga sp. TaxID=1964215 RepID=UPI003B8C36E8